MNSKIANAERIIDNVCKRFGVSREGTIWLSQALDPFKDMVRPHPGFPDKIMDPSVVEVVRASTTVTSPGGDTDWDCNIFIDQYLNNTPLFVTNATNDIRQRSGQGVDPRFRGGLIVRSDVAGNTLSIATTQNAQCLQVDPTLYDHESCRIIGIGFEVHDVTAELDKQGTLTAWRVPKPDPTTRNITCVEDGGTTACIPTGVMGAELPLPPFTVSEAVDLPGSLQWEAKKGIYSVPILQDEVNRPDNRGSFAIGSVEGGQTWFPQLVSAGASKLITTAARNCPNPFSMQGAYFTGLKSNAVLAVNFVYFLERFPAKDSTIKRLCYPSPDYDAEVFRLYSLVAHKLPVGVEVKENGLGDWISGVARLVSYGASFIPHPAAQLISKGAMFVANASESKIGKNMIQDIEGKVKKEPRVVEVIENSSNRPRIAQEVLPPHSKAVVVKNNSQVQPRQVVHVVKTNRKGNDPLSTYISKSSRNNANVWVTNPSSSGGKRRNRTNGKG